MEQDLEVVASELEALSFTYDHLNCTIQPALSPFKHTISLVLKPRNIEHEYEACVSCVLLLRVPPNYPAVSPEVELRQLRGMEKESTDELRAVIQASCSDFTGELVLGQAIEVALDYVTSINHPVGRCAICLEEFQDCLMERQGRADGSKAPVFVKLPCYHCFHSSCFWSWHSWQILGGRCAEENDTGMTTCPTCRTPASLKKDLPCRQCFESVRENQFGCQTATKRHLNNTPPHWSSLLSKDDVSRIHCMQRECAKGLQVQESRGGLVQRSVSVSVAELEARAASRWHLSPP